MTVTATLLGTGSPRPSADRTQPASVIRFPGVSPILLDAGEGAMYRLLAAGLTPADVGTVLLTHLHKDHILGYPAIVWGGWPLGRKNLRVIGPPGTQRMHDLLFGELFAADMDYSRRIGYGEDVVGGVTVEEIEAGQEFQLEQVSVRTARTAHSFYTVAYRLEVDDVALVFTGDTTYCKEVVELARGADLLVCEATLSSSPDYEDDRGQGILALLEGDHCSPQQAGRIAREADVGRLVLNHLIPGARRASIIAQCGEEFGGPIAVGEDLMTFSI